MHGTGFFMQMSKEVGDRLLITNWHVVEDLRSIRFLMHRSPQVYDASKSSKFVEINLKDAQRRWIRHPDPVVDLCAANLYDLCLDARISDTIASAPFLLDEIPSEENLRELRAVEEVVMVGYPNACIDEVNNLPLIRKGITASHPAVDFNGERKAAVDIACFLGSSGSPVVLLNEGQWFDRKGGMFHGSRCWLLGVLFEAEYLEIDGSPNIQKIPSATINGQWPRMVGTHLGFYQKARELLILAEEVGRKRGQNHSLSN